MSPSDPAGRIWSRSTSPRRTRLRAAAALACVLASLVAGSASWATAPSPEAHTDPTRSNPAPTAVPAPSPPPSPAADDSRFDSDAALAPHADDVADYTLTAALDPQKHTLHGDGTITWRNASSVPVRELWVHLYLNAFKNERSVWLRTPAPGFRGSEAVKDWGSIDVRRFALRGENGATTDLWPGAELHRPGDEDETDVRVPLPRDVLPGEKIQIDVAWDDKIPSVVERTGYVGSFHMIGQWFPKLARLEPDGHWAHFPFHHLAEFYADYGTYDVTLDVPQKFVIGATGPAVDTRIEGGRRIERHVQKDVHDFAFTAWDRWLTEKEVIDGVKVTVLYPPSYRVDAQRELRVLRFAIPDFSARYGRYPYEILTVVHPPSDATEAGGMEYPTLITTGGPWYGPPGDYDLEITAIHEYGHQYFYGLVGTNEVLWPFLDEGLNSYAEQLGMGAWLGPGSAAEILGFEESVSTIHAIAGNAAAHDAPVAQAAFAFERGADYGALVYSRPATLFETLRRTYGDEPVNRALGRYTRKFRYAHPTPEDLLAVFREVLGERVERTLRGALFDKGWVDYRVAEIGCTAAREPAGLFDRLGKRETDLGTAKGGFDGAVLVERHGTLSFPVDIDLVRADDTHERVHWDGDGESIRVPYHGAVALKGVVVDPDSRILLDEHRTNNFDRVRRQDGGARRSLERLFYWIELAMQAVLP